MGSSRHRETIVYSSSGPAQKETGPSEKRREEEMEGRVEKDGEKEEEFSRALE